MINNSFPRQKQHQIYKSDTLDWKGLWPHFVHQLGCEALPSKGYQAYNLWCTERQSFRYRLIVGVQACLFCLDRTLSKISQEQACGPKIPYFV